MVVLTTISMLATLLVAVLGTVKIKVQTAQCAKNLQQIGGGLYMYEADRNYVPYAYNRDMELPVGTPARGRLVSWYGLMFDAGIFEASEEVYYGAHSGVTPELNCPAADEVTTGQAAPKHYGMNITLSYLLDKANNTIALKGKYQYKISRITRPSERAWVTDAISFSTRGPYASYYARIIHDKNLSLNILHVDGHANTYEADDIAPGQVWGPLYGTKP